MSEVVGAVEATTEFIGIEATPNLPLGLILSWAIQMVTTSTTLSAIKPLKLNICSLFFSSMNSELSLLKLLGGIKEIGQRVRCLPCISLHTAVSWWETPFCICKHLQYRVVKHQNQLCQLYSALQIITLNLQLSDNPKRPHPQGHLSFFSSLRTLPKLY